MKDAHPDAGGDAEYAKRLNRAYEVLSKPESRARYDAGLPRPEGRGSLPQAFAYGLGVRIGRYAARWSRGMRGTR